ncbi:MAG: serine/threonine protein kinase [Deltaproteobacteria bacterium]|nr:serine/threonine protein kinase [Deltaproteobacteria bacterium]
MQAPTSQPMRLGRYQLVGKIGEGAHGVVYLANDPKLGREVAIKALQPDMAADEGVQMRFRREMKSCARLKHPNIVELVDFSDPDAEWPYLVMERLHGETLLDLINRTSRPLEPIAAAAAAHEICLALEHAHAQGIVHRDLKPENVFLEPNGRIVLCDFGIAVGFFGGDTLAGKNTKLLGSPLYMSPEQILADAIIGPPSDLFSLGALLHFLVTGQHAFGEESVLGVLKRISTGSPRPLPQGIADSRLGRIIKGLLQADVTKRYANASIVSDELLVVLSEGGHVDPRRALKNLLSGLTTDKARVTSVTAIEDLDRASKTLITKVAQGKPPNWDEVTGSGTSHTVTVNLAELRDELTAPGAGHGDHTQIATLGVTIGNTTSTPVPPQRSQMWTLVIGIAIILGLGVSAVFFLRPKPPPPLPPDTRGKVTPPDPPPDLPPPEQPVLPTPPIEKPPVVPVVKDPIEEPAKKLVPKAKVEDPGTVRIIAKPWAYVYIDGLQVGQTPSYREASLTPGKHKLRFVNPDYPPLTKEITVKSGDDTKLKVDLANP